MSMLISAGQTWGDYSVRMRRGTGGLGNAALRAAGTPEQNEKWGEPDPRDGDHRAGLRLGPVDGADARRCSTATSG